MHVTLLKFDYILSTPAMLCKCFYDNNSETARIFGNVKKVSCVYFLQIELIMHLTSFKVDLHEC